MTDQRERNVDDFEGRERISVALSRFFYFGNTKSILRWFGFFESSTHAAVYLVFMALFLFGVMFNFNIYQEFENEHRKFGVYCAGTPFVFLFISNLVSKLTFATGKNGNKLFNFLMVDERIDAVERNVVHLRYFCREFSSQLLRSRAVICGFGLFLVLFKVIVDICRLSQHASPFYSLCVIGFWCYLCLSTVIANGLVYMAAMGCKVHVTIFKNSLTEQGNSAITLYGYHGRLSDFLREFNWKFFCYFASQAVTCQIACYLVIQNMYHAYVLRQGDFMIAAVDFLCFILVEVPMFWCIRCVLNDLSAEIETIRTLAAEKIEQISLMSANERLISDWEVIGGYISHRSEGLQVFLSSSMFYPKLVLFLSVLPLGIAAISTLGKLTAYLLQWLPQGIF